MRSEFPPAGSPAGEACAYRASFSRQVSLDLMHDLFSDALLGGAEEIGPNRLFWAVSANCPDPLFVEVWGLRSSNGPQVRLKVRGNSWRPDALGSPLNGGDQTEGFLSVTYRVPCRKCSCCLRRRAREWTDRGVVETRLSAKTFFGTLTHAPGVLDWHLARLNESKRPKVQKKLRKARVRMLRYFEAEAAGRKVPLRDKFAIYDVVLGDLFRDYIKRLTRHFGKGAFRYLMVLEHHKSGLPHIHFLLHFQHQTPSRDLLRGDLSAGGKRSLKWGHGHADFRVVDPGKEHGGARYVCKYLQKEYGERVQASFGYGMMPKPCESASDAVNAARFERALRFIERIVEPLKEPAHCF